MTPRATARVRPTLQQESWIAASCSLVRAQRLEDLVVGLVAIPSPTGDEAPLAAHIASTLSAAGVDASCRQLDEWQANALGRIGGDGTGANLLLYAPIDTLTVGTDDEDVPWVGDELRPDMRPDPSITGSLVQGLGASNPKGHAACVMAAAEAIAGAQVPLCGDLLTGFGAAGMPTNARAGRSAGHGRGCAVLLSTAGRIDQALIAKPGWTASWEEVGLAWVEITVRGTHTYVGSRHRLPFRDPIVDAGTVVLALEAWFPEYTARHTTGTCEPQAIVAAIEGGWWRMAAVTPALCRLLVDLRLPPGLSATTAVAELDSTLDALRADDPGLDVSCRLVLDIPGTSTPVDSFVVEAAVEAWEHLETRPHEVITGNSGATDANIVRAHGIPTVRIGMPKVPDITDFQLGMNTVDTDAMVVLTQHLIRTAVNVCTRPRGEVVDR